MASRPQDQQHSRPVRTERRLNSVTRSAACQKTVAAGLGTPKSRRAENALELAPDREFARSRCLSVWFLYTTMNGKRQSPVGLVECALTEETWSTNRGIQDQAVVDGHRSEPLSMLAALHTWCRTTARWTRCARRRKGGSGWHRLQTRELRPGQSRELARWPGRRVSSGD